MRFALLTTIAALTLCTNAHAQDADCYFNIGISTTDNDSVKNSTFVHGRIGVKTTKNLAFEAEGGFGVNEETKGPIKLKASKMLGGYVVGIMPVSEKFSLLGRAGYNHIWAEAFFGPTKYNNDSGGFAAGVGAQYNFDEKNGIRADYTRFTDNDGLNNFAVSYVRKF